MTSMDNNINLYDFIEGKRVTAGVHPEESGLPLQGNINRHVRLEPDYLKKTYDNVLFNPISQSYRSYSVPTPLLYCNKSNKSELLPEYPNGTPNMFLSPDCNLKLNKVMSPTLYGETTAFVNDSDILNNPQNNIGHEVQTYGIANQFGMRALSQGKYANKKLQNGQNNPALDIQQNNNGMFYAKPVPVEAGIPLYQVGNWPEFFPNNFLKEFNDNIKNN